MEPPMHKVCGTRHWLNNPCPAAKTREELGVEAAKMADRAVIEYRQKIAGEKPAVREKAAKWDPEFSAEGKAHLDKVRAEVAPKIAAKIEKAARRAEREPGTIVAGYDFKAAAACPVCAMRRAKHAARMKAYRAKNAKAR